MEIFSRKNAEASGKKWYFTGKLCPHGHVASRAVSNYACKECLDEGKKTERYKKSQKIYKKSASGKKSNKKYEQSLKGRVVQKRQNAKLHQYKLDWQKTPKGRATKCAYSHEQSGLPRISPIPYPIDKKCQLCKNMNTKNRRLCRDHSHTSMKDRGWLCHQCNVGIGCLKDDIVLLKKAILYLENSENGVTNDYR